MIVFFEGNISIKSESLLSLLGILLVSFAKIAFCEAHIIDSIQQVGFSATIISTKAGNIPGKGKLGMIIIAELY